MLSLMYGGELCYWAWEMRKDSEKKREEEGEEEEEREDNIERESKGEGLEGKTLPQGESATRDREKPSNVMDTESACVNSLSEPFSTPPLFSNLLSQLKGTEYLQQYCVGFSPAVSGLRWLEKYIMMAQGPLKNQSWSYVRAVQLVSQLKHAV